jgi:ABC-type sugar transport system ATPase subunit
MTLAHRVAVMQKGKLQQFDTPMNIYERPANRFVAEFVGSPSMNFLAGHIDLSNQTFLSGEFKILISADHLRHDGRVVLGIRPEDISISTEKSAGDSLPARVYVTELLGNETFVFLMFGESKLIARAAADFRAEEEMPVWLSFARNKFHFFDPETGLRV